MSTQKERAWQALKLAGDRFSDAAIDIADSVVIGRQLPTESEIEDYLNLAESLARAHREYSKAIQTEYDK